MERIYVVPLKKAWRKASLWERAKRAMKFLKEFALKHMKAKEVKVDTKVNEVIWARGAKKPPRKIKVLMRKEGDVVYVTLPEVRESEVRGEGKVQAEGQVAEVHEGSGSEQ